MYGSGADQGISSSDLGDVGNNHGGSTSGPTRGAK
jgi:hypothetical protein